VHADGEQRVRREGGSSIPHPAGIEQDVVDDHVPAELGQPGDHPVQAGYEPVAERAGGDAERVALTGVAEDLVPAGRVEPAARQCEDDSIDPDGQQRIRKPPLQRLRQRRLPR